MKNEYGYQVGDLFKVIEDTHGWFNEGNIIKLIEDDGTNCPKFGVVTGNPKRSYRMDGVGYNKYSQLEPVYLQKDTFTPLTITLETLEDFEIMKAIMHLHNKVSESSFFNELEWTPDAEDVKTFMQEKFKELDTHHKGWSNYNKGE